MGSYVRHTNLSPKGMYHKIYLIEFKLSFLQTEYNVFKQVIKVKKVSTVSGIKKGAQH